MKTIKQFYKLLGIKDITTRMIPGEDKNIPFSRYDQILVTTITYISGETKNEYKYYRNISNSYNKIYEILFKGCLNWWVIFAIISPDFTNLDCCKTIFSKLLF